MRSTKLCPEVASRIILARISRNSIAACAKAGGVSNSTLKNWLSPTKKNRKGEKPASEIAFREAFLAASNNAENAETVALMDLARSLREVYPKGSVGVIDTESQEMVVV